MLTIELPEREYFDEAASKFVTRQAYVIDLEHSLFSIHKWESKWEIPFLAENQEKTDEQTIDYIRCMTITPGIPAEAYEALPIDLQTKISEYINAKMTATWFSDDPLMGAKPRPTSRQRKPTVTAEIVYYWMVTAQVPLEWEHRHFNQLMTLLQVIERKNQPEKKLSKNDLAARNRALNEARRQQQGTRG